MFYNVKKISRTLVNLALLSLCTFLTLGICSCNSSNSLHNLVDDLRPSSHFKSVDIHLSGDTLSYYRIRLPQK